MRGKLLELHQVSAMCSRWSPVLPVPPLTSTLLGSVEKSRSGIAAGVLNATRQTGSGLGVRRGLLAGAGQQVRRRRAPWGSPALSFDPLVGAQQEPRRYLMAQSAAPAV